MGAPVPGSRRCQGKVAEASAQASTDLSASASPVAKYSAYASGIRPISSRSPVVGIYVVMLDVPMIVYGLTGGDFGCVAMGANGGTRRAEIKSRGDLMIGRGADCQRQRDNQ